MPSFLPQKSHPARSREVSPCSEVDGVAACGGGQGTLLSHQLGRMRVPAHSPTLARPPELEPGLQRQKQPLAETGRQRGLPSLLPPPRGPRSLSALPPAVQRPPLRLEGLSIPGSPGKVAPTFSWEATPARPLHWSCPRSLRRVGCAGHCLKPFLLRRKRMCLKERRKS